MKLEKLESKLIDLKDRLGAVPYNHRAIWCNGQSIKSFHAEKKRIMEVQLLEHPAPTVRDPNSLANGVRIVNGVEFATVYACTKAAVDLLDTMPEYLEAVKIIDPLLAEITKIESEIAEIHKAEARANQEREDSKKAAIEKAISEVEASFATA